MRIKTISLAVVISLLLFGSNIAYGESASLIEINMPLPKSLDETNFDVDYPIKVNGADYIIKGSPFVYRDLTYMPARTILEIFHIVVKYNDLDRTIQWADKEKTIFISPLKTLYQEPRGALVRNGNKTETVTESYLLVNDLSYLPLRFIAETFGYTVNYDDTKKQITITGNQSLENQNVAFSDEQQAIIDAISGYEAKPTLSLKGIAYWPGDMHTDIEVNLNREYTRDSIVETSIVNEIGGKQYKGTRKVSWYGSMSIGVSEISPEGTEKIVNLLPFAGRHPYTEFSILRLCGLNKYGNMTIEKNQDNAEIVTYKITELHGEQVEISLSIKKNSGELIRYMENTKFGKKTFAISSEVM
ncbi:copper amine oxidase N-terminal domain-containing protein [Paenibacillus hamazuiensis]|uniref:copper amine oxidase N-terminal domain-containing protein n=1 Tax=Paenibacillus hamazuiensis TaxID=2936508 RepID=UPI00200D9B3F|nr:copper amine oxidase N-terminal domain-containing protein [Paenibacillus hamazuiensis]